MKASHRSEVVSFQSATSHLPSLIDRASKALAGARSSAEVLEACDLANIAYDASKLAARLAKAKGAHDALIAAAHRAQADALEIEAQAKRRLADEYDAAQERGEVQRHGGDRMSKVPVQNLALSDIGLNKKQIHEARLIRDAEKAEPGIIKRTLAEKLKAGEEPTKASLRQVVLDAAMRGMRGGRSSSRRNPHYVPPNEAEKAWTHIYGEARSFREWATARNISLALKGMREREDSQTSNIKAVRDYADILTKIVERIDAQ
jgi:hypothetical protein